MTPEENAHEQIGRMHVLNNEPTFERLVAFLLDSPTRYHWFGRRFVVMPDHIHLIAHMGNDAVRLGQWIKALKAVVEGLEHRVGARGLQDATSPADLGRVPSHGAAPTERKKTVQGKGHGRRAPAPAPGHDSQNTSSPDEGAKEGCEQLPWLLACPAIAAMRRWNELNEALAA